MSADTTEYKLGLWQCGQCGRRFNTPEERKEHFMTHVIDEVSKP